MAAVAPIFSIISAASTVFGAVTKMIGQSQAGSDQQQAYNFNAAVGMQNAAAVRDAAAADAATQSRINAMRLGKLTTGILHNGVELEGTPLLLLDEEAQQGALESAKIKQRGEVQATNYMNQANQATFAGQQAVRASDTLAGTTLLTGATSAAGNYYDQQMRIDNNNRPYRG